MNSARVYHARARVFLDTQIITLFQFLDEPDKFIPDGEREAIFIVTMPTVRELEKIKDEHFSSGQRSRAKRCLGMLENAEHPLGYVLTERSSLYFWWQEPSDAELKGGGLSTPRSPDDLLIGAVYSSVKRQSERPFKKYVLSDDIGIRIRVKHQLASWQVQGLRPPALRFKQETFELPRMVQEVVKSLAKELAANMREKEVNGGSS